MKYRSVYYKDGKLRILDQTLLPDKIEYIECSTHYAVCEAIKNMKVRGAPAIGIAAAYGMVLAADNIIKPNGQSPRTWQEAFSLMEDYATFLDNARPTAVNLHWATKKVLNYIKNCIKHDFDLNVLSENALDQADKIYKNEIESCRLIGKFGCHLIKSGMQVLTHCNAGALATVEHGTALAPLYEAKSTGKNFTVYVDETRPLLQGARLTAWELMQNDISTTLITDNCAAKLMSDKRVDIVIVGADRISKSGDVANKIGTYGLAILCYHHHIPFYVAAPESTFDHNMVIGSNMAIEIRDQSEICKIKGINIAPEGISAYNPAFDVTPAKFISGIITNKGIISPVCESEITRTLA